MAAFGTDLAWFYLNASRVQRAADAGALAGVVWLPGATGTANTTAQAVTQQNGYDNLDAGHHGYPAVVERGGEPTPSDRRDVVPTFFPSVFGFDTWQSSDRRSPSTYRL